MTLKPITDISLFAAMTEPHNGVFASEKWWSVYGKDIVLVGVYHDESKLVGSFYYLKTKKYEFNFLKPFRMVTTKNDQLLGVVFCIYYKHTCYYLPGGVNKPAGVQGVNNLLVQKSIDKAKELNCTVFDFEGSMLKGVGNFFRNFGHELVVCQ